MIELVVDDHVQALVAELVAFVHDTNTHFPPYLMAKISQFALQGHHIDVLEKPEPESVVNLVESTNGSTGELVLDQLVDRHDQLFDTDDD